MYSFCLILAVIAYQVTASAGTQSVGYRIYHLGIGADGNPVSASGIGGSTLSGKQAACANCHRRSGYGSSEGGMLAPPIIGKLLFSDRDFYYRELARNMSRPITRPAYTTESLATALHKGIAPNNKSLDELMPRYSMSDHEVRQLSTYLKTMGEQDAIGVDSQTIHLSTVITPGTAKHGSDAMLATLETYIRNINSESRLELDRARKSPWHKSWKYEAYRKWKLNIWRLTGSPKQWKEQLQQHYRKQPVFAMVSGIGNSTWQPVHDFCEENHIPCLFPTTRHPGISDEHYYSIYFSEGERLQQKAILKHIKKDVDKHRKYTVLQLYNNKANHKIDDAPVSFHETGESANSNLSFMSMGIDAASTMLADNKPENIILVSWISIPELTGLEKKYGKRIGRIYIPLSSLDATSDNHKFGPKIYLVRPYTLPSKLERSLLRATSWARINGISPVDNEISGNSYFAVTLLTKAIRHLRSNFSRNYMIERIEHMLDNNVFHSVYPHLTLGPGQRFASKGCYIIGPAHSLSAVDNKNADWLIP